MFLRQRDALGSGKHWPALFTTWVDYQVALYDDAGTVLAIGHAVPFAWDGTSAGLPDSIAGVLDAAERTRPAEGACTALAAIATIVGTAHQRRGLSRRLLEALRFVAAAHGLRALVALVRPVLKAAYPLASLERYVAWTTERGEPFDPWLRVHARLGARVMRVAPATLVITGPVETWEEWAGLRFPESGPYVVPGALQPVVIDLARDEGRYEDPGVWMHHSIEGGRTWS